MENSYQVNIGPFSSRTIQKNQSQQDVYTHFNFFHKNRFEDQEEDQEVPEECNKAQIIDSLPDVKTLSKSVFQIQSPQISPGRVNSPSRLETDEHLLNSDYVGNLNTETSQRKVRISRFIQNKNDDEIKSKSSTSSEDSEDDSDSIKMDDGELNHDMTIRTVFSRSQTPQVSKIEQNQISIQKKDAPSGILENRIKIAIKDAACQLTYFNDINEFLKLNSSFKVLNFKRNMIWDIQITIFTTVVIFLESLKICFYVEDKNNFITSQHTINSLIILIYMIDIVKNFITGYYQQGTLVKEARLVALYYLRGNFVYDFIGTFAFYTSTDRDYNKTHFQNYVRTLLFIKVLSLPKLINRIMQKFQTNMAIKDSIKLLKIILLIILLSHFSACGFFSLGKVEFYYLDITDTWLHIENGESLLDFSVFNQYAYSYFWASCLMIQSLVYMPKTNYEMAFTSLILFITCIIIAYVINSIGTILQDMSKQTENFEQDHDAIMFYMQKKQLPVELQYRVTHYLKYIHFEEKEFTSQKEQNVLKKLNKNLLQDLLKYIHNEQLQNIPVISANFSKKMVDNTACIMEEVTLSPQEILISKDDQSKDLYYIAKGELEILYEIDGQLNNVSKLDNQTTLNSFQFFTGQSYSNSNYVIRSSSFATIYKVGRQEFINKLEGQDFEKFFYLKDQIMNGILYENNHSSCFICGGIQHTQEKCLQTHYIPDKKQIFENYMKSEKISQERSDHLRQKLKKKNKSTCMVNSLIDNLEDRQNDYEKLIFYYMNEINLEEQNFQNENDDSFLQNQLEEEEQDFEKEQEENIQGSQSQNTAYCDNSYKSRLLVEQTKNKSRRKSESSHGNLHSETPALHLVPTPTPKQFLKPTISQNLGPNMSQNSTLIQYSQFKKKKLQSSLQGISETKNITSIPKPYQNIQSSQPEKDIADPLSLELTCITGSNFDKLNLYKIYYPQFNYDAILEQLSGFQRTKRRSFYLRQQRKSSVSTEVIQKLLHSNLRRHKSSLRYSIIPPGIQNQSGIKERVSSEFRNISKKNSNPASITLSKK